MNRYPVSFLLGYSNQNLHKILIYTYKVGSNEEKEEEKKEERENNSWSKKI